jgi:hypothetical protein
MDISSTGMMLLLMGIFHGINPGMGWLFAVGLGLQEQRRSAVWTALLPLAAGHAVAVAAAVALFAAAGAVVPAGMLKWGVAAVLFGFGVYKLFRRGHPRYGGMQVGPRELAVWSFLMASAHGAGLMVLPFISETPHAAHDHMHAMHASTHATMNATMHAAMLPGEPLAGLAATLLHTAGYLFVMGLIAVVVYEKLGLRLLRKSWINLDLIWAAALIVTAVLTPLL